MNFRGTVVIKKEEKWFVAVCIENGIASQGKTIDEAIFNLKEAISLYYEDEAETEETAQKGSHSKYTNGRHTVIIPIHDDVARGTLRSYTQ